MRIALLAVLLLAGCASQPLTPGFVRRAGTSNGPENADRIGVVLGYRYELLEVGNIPVRKNRTAHPIISGDAETGFVTKGTANQFPDKELLTLETYSGFVLVIPGMNPAGFS